MSEIDHLGEALREQLHVLVADLEPSAGLTARVEAIPTARQPRRWRRWFGRRRIAFTIPLPAAGLAVAALLTFGGGGASVATQVTVLPGGELRITDLQLFKVADTNAMLRRLHVRNIVDVPLTPSCRYWNVNYAVNRAFRGEALRTNPRKVRPGLTEILGIRRLHGNIAESVVSDVRSGHVPPCVSSHGWGAGMGPYGPLNPPKSK
jgi:hypothetical protein